MLKRSPALAYPSEKLHRLTGGFDEPEPITVLLVEDSRTVRFQLRGFIGQLERVTLVEAETLAEARSLLDANPQRFFCAILDLTLPDATGSEIVELVHGYQLPIIVLTSSIDPEIRQAVLEHRVIDYMLKSSAAAIEDVAYLVGRLRQNSAMTVMVVDDSATFRLHLTHLLEQYRFRVIVATNGFEALELLKQYPDTALIITDYHMPGISGLELIQRIRRDQRREDLAIIGISDQGHRSLSAAMIKAGGNDFLSKPFQPEEFYCRIVQNINMVRFVRQLREMANRDYLTRLYNRRYLFEISEVRHAEALLGRHQLAVGIVDADHFKQINDRYGHSTGDQVLRKIADTMRQNLTGSHLLARYGGEEFVCVLTLDNQENAGEDATRQFEILRRAIETFNLIVDDAPIHVTVSIGFTIDHGTSLAEMIEQADLALYRAKNEGRNRISQQLA